MKDIEQLKLILEQIGQTTESAAWVAITWIALDVLKTVVMWTGGILLAKSVITPLLNCAVESTRGHQFMTQCRDLVYPRQRGTYVSPAEARGVLQKLGDKEQ